MLKFIEFLFGVATAVSISAAILGMILVMFIISTNVLRDYGGCLL